MHWASVPIGHKGGHQRSLAKHATPALLGTQNRECVGGATGIDARQGKAKVGLKEIWMADTKAQANKAFDTFLCDFDAKYPKAVAVLEKDREPLLAFYDFPAEHWIHIRTTNPIESTFATIRHRTTRTKNCVSRNTLLGLVFQLTLTTEKGWRKIRGFKHLPDVIDGVRFQDGIAVVTEPEKTEEAQQMAA